MDQDAALPPVEVIAHRGLGQGTLRPEAPPENTLPAISAAWAAGADACEIDIHLSADGHIVVIHDDKTERTCGAPWLVREHTLAELRALDAGRWKDERWAGTPIPELGEVLATVPAGKRLFLELKSGPACLPALARAIAASGLAPAQLPIISFGIDALALTKRALPQHECHLLVAFETDYAHGRWVAKYAEGYRAVTEPADVDRLIAKVAAAGLDGIDASFAQPARFARRVRAAGLKCLAWTVNEPEVAVALARDGVTSITSDYPEAIRAALVASAT